MFIAALTCPDGWTMVVPDGSCYLLSMDIIANVFDALKFCEDQGSTLVEVRYTLQTLVQNLILKGEH